MSKTTFDDYCKAIVLKWMEAERPLTLEFILEESLRGQSNNFKIVVERRVIDIANSFDTREDMEKFRDSFQKGGTIDDHA